MTDKYPKINTIYKRDERTKSIILSDYSCPEFSLITKWQVEEKIDGTNIRVVYDVEENKIQFFGRNDESDIPNFILEFLQSHFTLDKLSPLFSSHKKVIIFGEGYGNRIQSAGPHYRKDVCFMLFDVNIDSFWQDREHSKYIADLLKLPFPPSLGIMSELEIIEFVKSKPASKCSVEYQIIEGIIARTENLLLFRNQTPFMWKLKVRDFTKVMTDCL